ncbi:MAG TPA: protein kinase [Polyangiaceae bacterium]|nr:protein kinase [Polyangiaceae bacterium]
MGSTTDDKFVGKTLPGGYHILDLISVGGMGRVYRAEQSALGRTVAVKIIHPHLLSDENSALRFITEARAASQLNHPNSIAVFDFGRTDDGQPYLVMEFLRGKDLARVAYEEGPLAFSRIVDVLRQTLAALSEAHDLGIVHRDLKPENIILEPLRRGGDFVKVVDFGLAKLRADTQAPGVTSPGIVCGTPDYMAPEQGRGDPIDGRSDLYAMGVILFQLLTGRLPFEADSPTQVVMMHMTIPVPGPRQVAPERSIPEPLVHVVNKALAKDAKKRYQDAIEFADALKSALSLAESVPPEQRFSMPPSSLGGPTLACPSCGHQVPIAKFCLECGTRLPPRNALPENHTHPSLPLPLVARDDDVTWLEDRRQQLQGAVVGARLVGEQGAGKTRLINELIARSGADGDLVAATGPDPHHAEVAGYALRTAIEALAGLSELEVSELVFDDANPDAEAGLVELFDPSPKRHDIRSPQERRLAFAEGLRWALARAAKRSQSGRIVLVVDDLQRVDGPSRNAFSDVLAEPPRLSALFLATHTPGFEAGWGAEAAARILPGLPPPAVSRLLRSSRSGARADDTGRGVLPMYVEQVLRYTQEGGSDPPARLADLIALRVDTLDPAARRTLQALAVMGDQVKPETVSEILRGENVEGTLPELRKAGMVALLGGRISTSHPLLRDIVLLGIPAAVKKDLHSRALRACERLGAPIEARAQHAYYAGDSFQALLLLEQVAERAAARGDTATEVLALRRGLEIARQEISRGELDDPLRAVLIFGRKLGASLTRAGNFADAEGVLREALDVAGPSGTDRARVLSALAHVSHGRRRSSEAMGYIDQAIAVARESGASDLVNAFADTRRAWVS